MPKIKHRKLTHEVNASRDTIIEPIEEKTKLFHKLQPSWAIEINICNLENGKIL